MLRRKNTMKRGTIAALLLLFVWLGYQFGAQSDDIAEPSKEKQLLTSTQHEMPASVDEVIKWKTRVEQNGCDATLIVEVTQLDGWHLYSQKHSGDTGFPTTFTFQDSDDYGLVGTPSEPHTELEDNDGYPERVFHQGKVVFKQKIKVSSKSDFKVDLAVDFMACKESCFPPDFREFKFNVKGCSATGQVDDSGSDDKNQEDPEQDEEVDDADTSVVDSLHGETITSPIGWKAVAWKLSDTRYELTVTPNIKGDWNIVAFEDKAPIVLTFDNPGYKTIGELEEPQFEDVKYGFSEEKLKTYKSGGFTQQIEVTEADSNMSIHASIDFRAVNADGELIYTEAPISATINIKDAYIKKGTKENAKSYWGIFLLAFGGGLLALLTPCVFPMIPLTVSFFTKGAKDKRSGIRRGIFYGISIFAIYVALSLPFHILPCNQIDASVFNEISTNVPLNVFFFLMLAVFAISFLGAFEITLPSKWTNKVDSASNVGGLIGIFLMALTLAIVSFSCTGPILGSLLAGVANSIEGCGEAAWTLTAGLAGFGLALGLPFALFAIFPSWLNSLPQSGGWLNNVKVVLGFLELAFAFKFLSQADMGLDLHLLEREVFIAIWIAIFGAMTMYLFNMFRTSHDSPTEKIGTFRLILATLTLMFTIYLIPGMWGAPLKLVSAFPPPMSYSESPYGVNGHPPEFEGEVPEGAVVEHNMVIFRNNYDGAMAYAQEKDLPLLLDFTGIFCVNCRKMENNVWSSPKVEELMKNKMVVASLYVDDRENDLDAPEISRYTGKKLTNHGQKWSEMQITQYGKSSQPQYIMLDHYEQMLTDGDATYFSHGNPEAFTEWLEEGINEFHNRKDVPEVRGLVMIRKLE